MEGKLKGSENQVSLLNMNMNKMKLEENGKEEEEENVPEENPLDLSPEHLELAQKILSIDLILVKILENLPTKSLVDFRRVDKTWEKEATNIIMKGKRTHMEFYCPAGVIEVAQFPRRKLRDLNECIRKSRGFPCSFIGIRCFSLYYSDLIEFCILHGSEIRRLDLKLHQQTATSIVNFFLVQVPNVQEFKIIGNRRDGRENNPTRLFPENAVLAHLESFSYKDFSSVSEIIRVSPNLKRVLIKDDSLNGVETLKSMNKIHLVREIQVRHTYENLVLLEKLADGNPKIEKIFVYSSIVRSETNEFLQRRFSNAVSKILDCSKETLTHVCLFLHHELLMEFKWPKLENVWKLSLCSGSQGEIEVPANFIFRVFPNIRKLRYEAEQLSSLLIVDTPLAHLKECELRQDEILTLDNLSGFAPNLTKLKIGYVKDFPGIANSLWSCSGLKQLEIGLLKVHHSSLQVDMAFTGLSEEIVRKLQKNSNYFNEMKMKKEISRVQRSILDCPGLTALEVEIADERIDVPDQIPLMTAVSGEFGFKMLENLQVEIKAREHTLDTLDFLKPYAKVSQVGW